MLLFISGFETFGPAGTPVGLNTTWVLNGTHTNTDLVAGRVSGLGLRLHSAVSASDIQINVGSQSALVCGFAYRPGAVLNNDGRVVSFRENDVEHVTLRCQSSGEVSIYRGTTHLATSSGAGLMGGAWSYIEVKASIHNSLGSYQVRVNGITVLSATNVDTQNGGTASVNNVRFSGNNSSDSANRITLDDVWIANTTGGGVTDFLGSMKVVAIYPDGAGDSTQFTPSTGANWQNVDEAAQDGDTTYNDGASGNLDLYNHQNVSGFTQIVGVQQDLLAKITDANPFNVKLACKSGSTTDIESAGQAVGGSFASRRRILETDPATGLPWDQAGVNAAQFGLEAE